MSSACLSKLDGDRSKLAAKNPLVSAHHNLHLEAMNLAVNKTDVVYLPGV